MKIKKAQDYILFSAILTAVMMPNSQLYGQSMYTQNLNDSSGFEQQGSSKSDSALDEEEKKLIEYEKQLLKNKNSVSNSRPSNNQSNSQRYQGRMTDTADYDKESEYTPTPNVTHTSLPKNNLPQRSPAPNKNNQNFNDSNQYEPNQDEYINEFEKPTPVQKQGQARTNGIQNSDVYISSRDIKNGERNIQEQVYDQQPPIQQRVKSKDFSSTTRSLPRQQTVTKQQKSPSTSRSYLSEKEANYLQRRNQELNEEVHNLQNRLLVAETEVERLSSIIESKNKSGGKIISNDQGVYRNQDPQTRSNYIPSNDSQRSNMISNPRLNSFNRDPNTIIDGTAIARSPSVNNSFNTGNTNNGSSEQGFGSNPINGSSDQNSFNSNNYRPPSNSIPNLNQPRFNPVAKADNSIDSMPIATVTTPRAFLKTAPDNSSSVITVINQGVHLAVETKQGNWFRVISPTGVRAWINGLSIGFGTSGKIPAVKDSVGSRNQSYTDGYVDGNSTTNSHFQDSEQKAYDLIRK